MIRYGLSCDNAHAFEGWFSSSDDFDRQAGMGLVTCPVCGSTAVSKLLMTPSVATARQKEASQTLVMDAVRKEMMAKLKDAVAAVKATAEDVGANFPDEARKIHYGEADARGIYGQASQTEVMDLIDEGIEIAALPILPDDVN